MQNKFFTFFITWLLFVLLLSAGDRSKRIYVFNNTPLKSALEQISENQDVSFVYADETVRKIKITGEFDLREVAAGIKKLLENTGVRIGVHRGQIFVLVQDNSSQRVLNIHGKTYDLESGESLPYTHITILETGNTIVSDENGNFEFINIPYGSLTLKARYIGYSENVYFLKPEALEEELKIPLSKSDLIMKNVVVIDSTQNLFDSGEDISQMMLDHKSLSSFPVNGQKDVFRCLKLLSGLNEDGSGNSVLRIRGGLESQNQILLDGINLYHTDYFLGMFSTIPFEIVNDIRVYKSGYGASHGGKIGGIIDITTKNGSTKKYGAQLEVNNIGINGTFQIPVTEKLSVYASGRRLFWTESFGSMYRQVSLSNKEVYDEFTYSAANPALLFYDAYVKVVYFPDVKNLLMLSGFHTFDESDIWFRDYSVGSNKPGIENSQDEKRRKNLGVGLNWFHLFSDRIKLKSTFSYSRYNSRQIINDSYVVKQGYKHSEYITKNRLKNFLAKAEVDYKHSNNLQFKAGLEHQTSVIDFSKYEGKDYEPGTSFSQMETIGVSSFYLSAKSKFSDRLNISPGFRVTTSSIADKFYLEPRIKFSYKLNEDMHLKGAYGIYNQFIIKDAEYNRTTKDLKSWVVADEENYVPSASTHYIIGVKYKYAGFLFDAECYFIDRENVFSPYFKKRPDSYKVGSEQNIDNGYSHGIEIQITNNVGPVKGWINYSYNNSQVYFKNPYRVLKLEEKGLSAHVANLFLSYTIFNVNLSSLVSYGSGSTYYYDGDYLNWRKGLVKIDDEVYFYKSKLPDHLRVDLSASYDFKLPWFKVSTGISVYNLLDRENIWKKNANYSSEEGLRVVEYKGFGQRISFFTKIYL